MYVRYELQMAIEINTPRKSVKRPAGFGVQNPTGPPPKLSKKDLMEKESPPLALPAPSLDSSMVDKEQVVESIDEVLVEMSRVGPLILNWEDSTGHLATEDSGLTDLAVGYNK